MEKRDAREEKSFHAQCPVYKRSAPSVVTFKILLRRHSPDKVKAFRATFKVLCNLRRISLTTCILLKRRWAVCRFPRLGGLPCPVLSPLSGVLSSLNLTSSENVPLSPFFPSELITFPVLYIHIKCDIKKNSNLFQYPCSPLD